MKVKVKVYEELKFDDMFDMARQEAGGQELVIEWAESVPYKVSYV